MMIKYSYQIVRCIDVSITGYIQQSGEKITFICDNYKFTFVRNTTSLSVTKIDIHADSYGYIWGITNTGRKIAIYVKNDIEIYNTNSVYTWNYIIANSTLENPSRFSAGSIPSDEMCPFMLRGIRFLNGPIKSVFPCDSLKEDIELEMEVKKLLSDDSILCMDNPKKDSQKNESILIYRARDISRDIDIYDGEEKVKWCFANSVYKKNSLDDGVELNNYNSYLSILFQKDKAIDKFYDYYGYVTAVMSFLTFRGNVSFDKVELLGEYSTGRVIPFAECYIRVEGAVSKKRVMESISVSLLSDESFRILIESEMKDAEEKNTKKKGMAATTRLPYLPLAILPKNDDEVGKISANKIRDICSCLEAEIEAASIKVSDDELGFLIGTIKSVIRKHRKGGFGKTILPQKTYDNIFSSIAHWGDSASDRAIKAWTDHYEECLAALDYWNIGIKEKDIAELIKTRNNITHRGFRSFSEKDGDTAIAMIILVYVLALERIGMSRNMVIDVLKRRLLG